jgi:hypothetical protein
MLKNDDNNLNTKGPSKWAEQVYVPNFIQVIISS